MMETVSNPLHQDMIKLMAGIVVSYSSHLVCFFWLWWAAKEDSLSEKSWSVFGLAFGMIAVAIFYGASIYYRQKGTECETT